MNSQNKSQMMTVSSLDSELIFDVDHLLMNYLKLNSFNQNCFSETTILISEEMKNILPQSYQSHTSFATKYFTLLIEQNNAIDIISPIISYFFGNI